MSAHTPGPWTKKGTQIRKGDFYIASSRQSGLPPEEAAANARLIASAPSLLHALKKCMAQLEILLPSSGVTHDERQAIIDGKNAIAEAEGDK